MCKLHSEQRCSIDNTFGYSVKLHGTNSYYIIPFCVVLLQAAEKSPAACILSQHL